MQEEGRRRGLPVVVMIFEPQPLELFATDKAPARLTRLREKLHYLAQCGVDYVLCVKFDRRFAALTAQTFISELLVERLGVQFLAVGDDFRFGASRAGDFLLLQKAGRSMVCGFQHPNLCEGGVRISSTAVRQALAEDNRRLPKACWDIPLLFPGVSFMATSWDVPLASRRRTYRCAVRSPRSKGLCGGSHRAWR